MATFGEGLGGVIGGAMASEDLAQASNTEDNLANSGAAFQAPYQGFGSSFLAPTGSILGNDASVGAGRFGPGGDNVQSYQDFMANYQTSPAAQYTIEQGNQAINNSAAARGGLLSGANLRALNTNTQNIASTFANQAYGEYLQGNQQQFGQLESVLGNLFQGIGVGQTANAQQSGLIQSNMQAQANIAAAQAKADQGKGSGLGSMFGGLAGLAAK